MGEWADGTSVSVPNRPRAQSPNRPTKRSEVTRTVGTAGANFLDPTVLGRISSLELIARTVVEGFISGLHHAPYLGMSMDFAEHRAYMPGDDIRRIDWRLYARTDRYFIKQFEADTNTNFSVLLDISKSMDYKADGISKLDYARYLAACLTYFSQKQRDRVGLITFDNKVVNHIPPSAKHLDEILYTLDKVKPGAGADMETPIKAVSEHFRRRSILVLISDFYEQPDKIMEAMKYLVQKGNDVIAFHILDKTELDFPFKDAMSFEDAENGERMPVIPEQARQQYQQLINAHIETISKRMAEFQIDYAMMDTSTPLDFALFKFLSYREQMSRTR
jgi:uncharacterized protein (DUF58 family)